MEEDTVKPHRRSENREINPENDKVLELDNEMDAETSIKIVNLTHRTENSQFIIEKTVDS